MAKPPQTLKSRQVPKAPVRHMVKTVGGALLAYNQAIPSLAKAHGDSLDGFSGALKGTAAQISRDGVIQAARQQGFPLLETQVDSPIASGTATQYENQQMAALLGKGNLTQDFDGTGQYLSGQLGKRISSFALVTAIELATTPVAAIVSIAAAYVASQYYATKGYLQQKDLDLKDQMAGKSALQRSVLKSYYRLRGFASVGLMLVATTFLVVGLAPLKFISTPMGLSFLALKSLSEIFVKTRRGGALFSMKNLLRLGQVIGYSAIVAVFVIFPPSIPFIVSAVYLALGWNVLKKVVHYKRMAAEYQATSALEATLDVELKNVQSLELRKTLSDVRQAITVGSSQDFKRHLQSYLGNRRADLVKTYQTVLPNLILSTNEDLFQNLQATGAGDRKDAITDTLSALSTKLTGLASKYRVSDPEGVDLTQNHKLMHQACYQALERLHQISAVSESDMMPVIQLAERKVREAMEETRKLMTRTKSSHLLDELFNPSQSFLDGVADKALQIMRVNQAMPEAVQLAKDMSPTMLGAIWGQDKSDSETEVVKKIQQVANFNVKDQESAEKTLLALKEMHEEMINHISLQKDMDKTSMAFKVFVEQKYPHLASISLLLGQAERFVPSLGGSGSKDGLAQVYNLPALRNLLKENATAPVISKLLAQYIDKAYHSSKVTSGFASQANQTPIFKGFLRSLYESTMALNATAEFGDELAVFNANGVISETAPGLLAVNEAKFLACRAEVGDSAGHLILDEKVNTSLSTPEFRTLAEALTQINHSIFEIDRFEESGVSMSQVKSQLEDKVSHIGQLLANHPTRKINQYLLDVLSEINRVIKEKEILAETEMEYLGELTTEDKQYFSKLMEFFNTITHSALDKPDAQSISLEQMSDFYRTMAARQLSQAIENHPDTLGKRLRKAHHEHLGKSAVGSLETLISSLKSGQSYEDGKLLLVKAGCASADAKGALTAVKMPTEELRFRELVTGFVGLVTRFVNWVRGSSAQPQAVAKPQEPSVDIEVPPMSEVTQNFRATKQSASPTIRAASTATRRGPPYTPVSTVAATPQKVADPQPRRPSTRRERVRRLTGKF